MTIYQQLLNTKAEEDEKNKVLKEKVKMLHGMIQAICPKKALPSVESLCKPSPIANSHRKWKLNHVHGTWVVFLFSRLSFNTFLFLSSHSNCWSTQSIPIPFGPRVHSWWYAIQLSSCFPHSYCGCLLNC